MHKIVKESIKKTKGRFLVQISVYDKYTEKNHSVRWIRAKRGKTTANLADKAVNLIKENMEVFVYD